MRRYATEALIGLFIAAVIVIAALASVNNAVFVYQGF